jgi:hypothetical protein
MQMPGSDARGEGDGGDGGDGEECVSASDADIAVPSQPVGDGRNPGGRASTGLGGRGGRDSLVSTSVSASATDSDIDAGALATAQRGAAAQQRRHRSATSIPEDAGRSSQAAPASQNRRKPGGRASSGREGRGNESPGSVSESAYAFQSEGERYASLSAFSNIASDFSCGPGVNLALNLQIPNLKVPILIRICLRSQRRLHARNKDIPRVKRKRPGRSPAKRWTRKHRVRSPWSPLPRQRLPIFVSWED